MFRIVKMVFETMNPTIAVFLISAITLLIINVFYRILINQDKAGDLKKRVKMLSDESKQHKNDPEKQKEFMKEMMASQRDMMRMNMKPMIVSLIVVAIALPLLAAEFHDVIAPLDATEIKLNSMIYPLSISENTITINDNSCEAPCTLEVGGRSWNLALTNNQVKGYMVVAVLPFSLPIVGSQLGWIVWYIITSVPLAIIIRAAYGIRT